jgi:hypothetical protein
MQCKKESSIVKLVWHLYFLVYGDWFLLVIVYEKNCKKCSRPRLYKERKKERKNECTVRKSFFQIEIEIKALNTSRFNCERF